MIKSILVLMLLSTIAQAQVHEVNAPTYVRFTIADPEFSDEREDPLIGTMRIDRKQNIAQYGDAGEPLAPCDSSWHCLSIRLVTLAVPHRCDQKSADGSWRYGNRSFRIVDRIDSLETNSKRIRYVIEGFGEDGKRESVMVYSERKGLESFAVVDVSDGHRTLVHYYLSGKHGALAGGCVTG